MYVLLSGSRAGFQIAISRIMMARCARVGLCVLVCINLGFVGRVGCSWCRMLLLGLFVWMEQFRGRRVVVW